MAGPQHVKVSGRLATRVTRLTSSLVLAAHSMGTWEVPPNFKSYVTEIELHLVNTSTRVSYQHGSFKLKTRVSVAQLCFVVLPLFAQTGRLYYWCVKLNSVNVVCVVFVFVYVSCVWLY